MSRKNKRLPSPISRSEAISLEPFSARTRRARTERNVAAGLALVAGAVLGADLLSDQNLDLPGKVATVTMGASAAEAVSQRRKENQAIEEAHDLLHPEQMTVHVQVQNK